MRNSIRLILLISILLISISAKSQHLFTGKEANKYFSGAEMIRIGKENSFPDYIKFSKGHEIIFNQFDEFFLSLFNGDNNYSYKKLNQTEDQFKDLHLRYCITFKGIAVQNAMFILHIKNNLIYAINGNIPKQIQLINEIEISDEEALQAALKYTSAQRYKWQMPEEENLLKKESGNAEATYYPKAEMFLYQKPGMTKYLYTYCFDIYADKPLKRADIYIDASNGEFLFENLKIHHIDSLGSAVTKFSGTQPITTNYTGSGFNLRETIRGQGIETYNMLKGTSYGAAVDFTDTDNIWNNVNAQKDEIATDAHWGAEKTWDYYWHKYKRNSIDGSGFKLKSYVHYDVNYANAFWDGQRMTYGDGNTSWQPLVALDIAGHEITHGLTSFTANLDYSYESGALNEAYSDIFGCAIEFYAKPTQANWLMGENIGTPIRSISNPNLYSQPDTYHGTMWYSGTNDNGGVHTNSGVLNFWFYLLSVGGSGSNDNGNSYNVTGIGVDSAAAIAYRTLTSYLVNTSNYADARFYSIMSAIDLYGACSQKVISTTNAFYAVGVGAQYIPGVQSNFAADFATFCQPPATVNFINQSNNASNYIWDFGDGSTSNLLNPSHVYTTSGLFNVKLISLGGSCGSDSIIKNQFVSILPTNPCVINLPLNGYNTMTACNGTLFDNGGSGNYSDNSVSTTTITAIGAANITVTFSSFSLEDGYDFLYIYDGPNSSSPLIGSYSGNLLPNGGSITSSTNRLTFRMTADAGVNQSGFVASWHCNMPVTPPQCNFMISDTNSCVGNIHFTDNSLNGPLNWFWDFGDGYTSNLQDPSHYYQSNGFYTVKLKVSNAIGSDSVIKTNILSVNKPPDPIKPNDTSSCGPSAFTLNSAGFGIKWYNQQNASIPFDTGAMIITPVLTSNTTYYLEKEEQGGNLYGGKSDNTGGGGYFNSANQHYLVFNCNSPTILKSVKVYAASAGNRTFELQDSFGNILDSRTVNVPSGSSRVNLNFNLPAQSDLRLAGPLNPNLYRNNAGCNFPYTVGNNLIITKSSATQNPTGYYYFFYDWEIQDEACKSNRLPVNIYINSTVPQSVFTDTINNLQISFFNHSIDANSFLWKFGDGSTSVVNNPVHTYANTGTYNVELISYNSCGSDTASQSITISVGINDIEADNISVFPNPVNDNLNIKVSGNQKIEKIQIYNIDGKMIFDETLTKQNSDYYTIDISGYSKGIYFLNIQLSTKAIIRKIVKL